VSRSGYSYDCDDEGYPLALWRGAVASSLRGRRGQAFLRELIAALDALPEKKLIRDELRTPAGVCALGAVGAARGLDLEALDPHDYDGLARTFGVAAPLVRELEHVNDERAERATDAARWELLRSWAQENLRPETP